jgi:hypothetical protein
MKSKAEAFGENLIKNLAKSDGSNNTKTFDIEILVQSKAFSMKIASIKKSKNNKTLKRIRILEQSNSDSTEALSDNMANIDFENCKIILMNIYNITEESIVMKQMDYNAKTNIDKMGDATQSNSTNFAFFNIQDNEKLNTTYCKGISVPISLSIPNSERLNMQLYTLSAKLLEGTDVYNKESPSFHSRCFKSFDFNTTADISINARRTNLYQNDSMNCSPGCDYKGIDDERKVICDCSELGESELSNNSTLDDLFKMPAMNFDISLCYNQVFLNVKFLLYFIYFPNIFFYHLLITIIFQNLIRFFIIYLKM